MRYKAQFKPSQLLCPERFTWHFASFQLLEQLDLSRYVVLSDLFPVYPDPTPRSAELTATCQQHQQYIQCNTVATSTSKAPKVASDVLKLISSIHFRSGSRIIQYNMLTDKFKRLIKNSLSTFAQLMGNDLCKNIVVDI